MYLVDFSLPMWQYLYAPLYARVNAFATKYDLAGDTGVRGTFVQLVAGTAGLYLLTDFAEGEYTRPVAHALLRVLDPATVCIEQMENDTQSDFAAQVLAWIETTLKTDMPHLDKIIFSTARDERAFMRKYGFRVLRRILVKDLPHG